MRNKESELTFLTESVDRIDNAVWAAVREMAHNADHMDWDMAIIGEVCDFIEETLKAHNISTCYPFQTDDETICYASADRCSHCMETFDNTSFAERNG